MRSMKRFYIFICLQILLLLVIERVETNDGHWIRFIYEEEKEEEEEEEDTDTHEEEFDQQQQAETIEWDCETNVMEVQQKFNSIFNTKKMEILSKFGVGDQNDPFEEKLIIQWALDGSLHQFEKDTLRNLCLHVNSKCYINQSYLETQNYSEINSYDNQNESSTSATSIQDIVSASFPQINNTTNEKSDLIEKISILPLVKCAVHEPGLNFFLSVFTQPNIVTLFILKREDDIPDATNIEFYAYTQIGKN